MRTILITGFGRFPGSPVNPSGIMAERIAKRRRPAFNGMRRVAHVFATRYDAVDRELPALIAREKPRILVMFGVATRARQVRIEERARNRVAMFPDASRRRPKAQTIAHGVEAVRNPRFAARLATAARATGVAVVRSRNAGTYLCNYVYWRGLEAAARPGGPDIVIFVHVPPTVIKDIPKRSAAKRPGTPAKRNGRLPRIDELVRAGEAIVLEMMSLAK